MPLHIEGSQDRIQIDCIGPLTVTSRGNKYCLVVIDPFTKWTEAIPTKTDAAQVTAIQFFNIVFSQWGLPKQDSDQSPLFTRTVMQDLCKILGIKERFHIARHPQSLGHVEWSDCTLKDFLCKVVGPSDKDWYQKLLLFLIALRVYQNLTFL